MQKKHFHICLWLCFLAGTSVFAQTETSKSFYVIIGGFKSEANANRFVESAADFFDETDYALNVSRGIFYVYTFKGSKRAEAYAMAAEARSTGAYQDAWVFYGSLQENVTEQPTPVVAVTPTEPVEIEEVVEEVIEESVTPLVTEKPIIATEVESINPDLRPFRFSLLNETTGEEVLGKVYVAEQRESNTFETYNGNERVLVKKPANRAQTYSVVINAPGYLPVETVLDYATSADQSSVSTVTIPLEKVRKGEYVEFNNVSFLINSALLTPNSEDELEAFAQLLKNNPKYKIRVHGHCNGKFDRNAIIKSEGVEFFDRSEGNEEIELSPKKLTKYRADIVKEYLVEQGIETKRIKTTGVGGQAMLFPANGPLSKLNDRVEVEIVKGK